jgi:endonuclease YncB( thermonuclease family)
LIITILLCVIAGASYAGESRPWVTLTNCEYVANKYNDGDSFRVSSGTNEFTLRLYYVDAPETMLTYPERVHQQSEHYGITLDETMKAGVKAKERVQELLREPFIVRTRWASAAGRGRETRYYGLVEVGGKSLAEVLVSEGLAQTKGVAPNLPSGEKASAYMQQLEGLEQAARQNRRGAWATAPPDKKEKDLGVVELIENTPQHFSLGDGKGCTVTGKQLSGDIEVDFVIEATNVDGTVAVLSRPKISTSPGRHCVISVGDVSIGLTPKWKTP